MTEDTYPGDMSQTQSLNRYSYVMNNPVNAWDPTGHVARWFTGGATEGYVMPELPSYIRNNEVYTTYTLDGEYNSSWIPQRDPLVEKGPTTLIDKVQEVRNYH